MATGESIQRSATVTGATSLELSYSWDSVGLEIDGSDNIIVEYSIDGTNWTTARTLNGSATGTYTDTIPWLPTNNTAFVRFRAEDAIEAGEQARIDNVQLRFVQNLRTQNFNLSAGQSYVQADLGFRATPGTATIGDTVWVDANGDQLRNPGEVGLAGITVDLYQDTNGDGLPDGVPVATTVTGPGGAYLFSGIAADGVIDYVVTMNTGQAPLTGYTATTFTLFSYPNLASGSVRVDADFGFQNPSATFTITDGVWLDNGAGGGTANDGIKNGAEAGIGGVTVDLLNSAGQHDCHHHHRGQRDVPVHRRAGRAELPVADHRRRERVGRLLRNHGLGAQRHLPDDGQPRRQPELHLPQRPAALRLQPDPHHR